MTATPIDFQSDVLISGGVGYSEVFVFTAPATRPYKVTTSGGTGGGDFDMMVSINSEPLGDPDYIYDYGSFNGGSDELVEFLANAGDEVFIRVERYDGDIVDLVLRADIAEGELAPPPPVSANLPTAISRKAPPTYKLRAPVYGPAGWLAGNSKDTSYLGPSHLLRCTDGVRWLGQTLVPACNDVNVRGMATNGTNYALAYLYNPSGTPIAATAVTTDAINYTRTDIPGGTGITVANLSICSAMVHGGGVYVMLLDSGKSAMRSADGGTTWTKHAISATGCGFSNNPQLVYASGKFISNSGDSGQYGVYTSPDGITWTRQATGTLFAFGCDLATDGTSVWIKVQAGGYCSGTAVTAMTARSAPPAGYANSMQWDGEHFVVAALSGGNSGTAMLHAWNGSGWVTKALPPLSVQGEQDIPIDYAVSAAGVLACTQLMTQQRFMAGRIVGDPWSGNIYTFRELLYKPSGNANWLKPTFVPVDGYDLNTDRCQTLVDGPAGLLYGVNGRGFGLLPHDGSPAYSFTIYNVQADHKAVVPLRGKYLIASGPRFATLSADGTVNVQYISGIAVYPSWTACSNGSRAVFINVMSDEHLWTDDGVTYTEIAMGFFAAWWSVVWFKGYFHLFGYDGAHARSLDGITWESMPALGYNGYPEVITSGETLTVYAYQPNDIFVTSDGDTFTRIFAGQPATTVYAFGIATGGYSAGVFAMPCFRNNPTPTGAKVLASLNGRSWIEASSLPTPARFSAVCPIAGGFAISEDYTHSVLYTRAAVGKFWTGFIACEESAE